MVTILHTRELRANGLEAMELLTSELLPDSSAPLAALWAFATRAGRLMEAFTREVVTEQGLDVSEFTILGTMWFQDSPHRTSLRQLTGAVALSQPGITRALQRAERNGNIRKVDDAADRRKVVVELTPQGHERADRAIRELLRRLQERLGPMDDESMRQIAAGSLKLARALTD
jgi:DNA-binding MarR family transcriptional regulator